MLFRSARNQSFKVNVSDLKPFIIPDTKDWVLNADYLIDAKMSAGISQASDISVILDFHNLQNFTLQFLESSKNMAMVIPFWPCAPWFKPLRRFIQIEAIDLPNKPDTFLDKSGNPIGNLSWKNLIVFSMDLIVPPGIHHEGRVMV